MRTPEHGPQNGEDDPGQLPTAHISQGECVQYAQHVCQTAHTLLLRRPPCCYGKLSALSHSLLDGFLSCYISLTSLRTEGGKGGSNVLNSTPCNRAGREIKSIKFILQI